MYFYFYLPIYPSVNIFIITTTTTKGLLKSLEDLKIGGRVETIKTTALLRTARNPETSPGDLRRLAVTQTPV